MIESVEADDEIEEIGRQIDMFDGSRQVNTFRQLVHASIPIEQRIEVILLAGWNVLGAARRTASHVEHVLDSIDSVPRCRVEKKRAIPSEAELLVLDDARTCPEPDFSSERAAVTTIVDSQQASCCSNGRRKPCPVSRRP